jgi:hypothetical protein
VAFGIGAATGSAGSNSNDRSATTPNKEYVTLDGPTTTVTLPPEQVTLPATTTTVTKPPPSNHTAGQPQHSQGGQGGGDSSTHFTSSQQQAIGAAQDYLSTEHFSKEGLIKQLSSTYGDGFSLADATFAVNHIDVNWFAQAVGAAKDYLSIEHFSRDGLIQQLSSSYGDDFTLAQATYAANKVGLS